MKTFKNIIKILLLFFVTVLLNGCSDLINKLNDIFKEKEYIITYDTDGGNIIPDTVFKKDDEVILQVPTKEGYEFIGWYEGESKIEVIDELRNYQLKAKWKEAYVDSDYEFEFDDANQTAIVVKYYGNDKELTIPENIKQDNVKYKVTSIGEEAFSSCHSLTGITIPTGVTSIGDGAFRYCSALSSIIIPAGVKTIGDEAFLGCSSFSFTSIVIPDTVTSIGDYAFSNCYSLTSVTIPDSVTSIGNYAFSNCYPLTSVTIPDSVTSIGEGTFKYCSSLTSIVIPDSATSIGDEAFRGCGSLSSITIGNSVTSIGKDAFNSCDGVHLTSIVIPDSVTSIGEGAFRHSHSHITITIPASVTSIGKYAFADFWGSINCEATEKPSGWDDEWWDYRDYKRYLVNVNWGYKK